MGYELNFSDYICERTRDFTGREWVFAEIDGWLARADAPRYFIITAVAYLCVNKEPPVLIIRENPSNPLNPCTHF